MDETKFTAIPNDDPNRSSDVPEDKIETQEPVSEETAAEPTQESPQTNEEAEQFSFAKLNPKIKTYKKVLFALLLFVCIGIALYFSFNALSLDSYEYEEKDGGWQLSGFHNDGSVTELKIEYAMVKKGVDWTEDTSRSITSIRQYAVCCDEYIETIFIGKDVVSIEDHAFYSCKNLQAIYVDPENPAFCSENGILFSKDKTKIIQFPISYVEYKDNALVETTGDQKTMRYVLPDTVTEIGPLCFAYAKNLVSVTLPGGVVSVGNLAFFKCESLESVNLPDGLSSIGTDCFSYCKKLTYLYLPASIRSIGHHAFYECSGLETIDTALSQSDFERLELGDYWKNVTLLQTITIQYDQPGARK